MMPAGLRKGARTRENRPGLAGHFRRLRGNDENVGRGVQHAPAAGAVAAYAGVVSFACEQGGPALLTGAIRFETGPGGAPPRARQGVEYGGFYSTVARVGNSFTVFSPVLHPAAVTVVAHRR